MNVVSLLPIWDAKCLSSIRSDQIGSDQIEAEEENWPQHQPWQIYWYCECAHSCSAQWFFTKSSLSYFQFMMSDSKFIFVSFFIVLNCNVAIDLFVFSSFSVSIWPAIVQLNCLNREAVLFSQLQPNAKFVRPANAHTQHKSRKMLHLNVKSFFSYSVPLCLFRNRFRETQRRTDVFIYLFCFFRPFHLITQVGIRSTLNCWWNHLCVDGIRKPTNRDHHHHHPLCARKKANK